MRQQAEGILPGAWAAAAAPGISSPTAALVLTWVFPSGPLYFSSTSYCPGATSRILIFSVMPEAPGSFTLTLICTGSANLRSVLSECCLSDLCD